MPTNKALPSFFPAAQALINPTPHLSGWAILDILHKELI